MSQNTIALVLGLSMIGVPLVAMLVACFPRLRSSITQAEALQAKPADDRHPTRADLVAALEFYAAGHHFVQHQPECWDTVSGEPANFQEDEAGTATVEDGSIAKATLAGACHAEHFANEGEGGFAGAATGGQP